MKLESDGILISLTPIAPVDMVARIFTRDFGVMRGVMRGGAAGRNRRPPLVGQICGVSWNARLDSQLGAFHWEPMRNIAAPLMSSRNGLAMMNAAFDLIGTFLPERESYLNLYNDTLTLCEKLTDISGADDAYLTWEVALLRELGYALDLSHCSGCGGHDKLHYISPRTGRAVCDTCGAPYISRLFHMPLSRDITLHFLTRAAENMGTTVPGSRLRLGVKIF